MRFTVIVSVLLTFALVGCQAPETQETTTPEATPTSSSEPEATSDESASTEEVTAGMGMADVKKIKGAPDDTKHEHGEGGAEIDIWIYGSEEIKFVNGKVDN